MESRNSLSDIHSAFNTSPEDISAIIRKMTGKQSTVVVPMHAGYDSEVYHVELGGLEPLVLKINHEQKVTYKQEAWAMNEAKRVGVPVANVYGCDKHLFPDGEREVMIQSFVQGTKFQDRRTTITPEEFARGLQNMGEVLAKLHTVDVSGCYRRHEDGSWDFSDLDSLIKSTITSRKSEHNLLIEGGLSEDQLDQALQLFDSASSRIRKMRTVLNHGDYLPDHVFVDDQLQVTGVIDFGSFQGDSRTHDFAFVLLMGPNIQIKSLIEGYGNNMLEDMEVIRAQALMLALGHLAHKVKKNYRPEAKFVLEQIERLIAMSY